MKAVIIEDEPLAIENLKHYLREYPVEIIGSAFRIRDAVKLIENENPDVVFLDINLSGENGFDLLEKVKHDFRLVFVTAYDEYALRAFEVNALDYILKPLSKERIRKTVSRLFEKNEKEIHPKFTIDDSIFLSIGEKAYFLKLKDVVYIEADSCYSIIYLADGTCKVVVKTLKNWENILPENYFFRIHRSYVVNINYIGEIQKRKNGTFKVVLNNSKNMIEISRRNASNLRSKLNI